jgi:ATP-dependent Clp endopeptidase proteolytic subunit ClpP
MAYQILNKSKDRAEIHLYEDIGEGWFGGVSAKTFVDDIKKLGTVNHIDLRINSPGGSVFEGVTIYNVLKSHSARIVAHIDGLAASIASIVAMAGDEIHMADNALMMIHDPWGMSVGTAEDMRNEAEVLDTVKQTLIDTYAKRTGQDKDKIAQMMEVETWMSAAEAVDMGFADFVTDEELMAAAVDVSRYKYKHLPTEYSNSYTLRAKRDARFTRIAAATNRLVPPDVRKRRK